MLAQILIVEDDPHLGPLLRDYLAADYQVHHAANDLLGIVMDPNTHIQESKVSTCDIVPGRRPRGAELLEFVESYRRRAGVESGRVGRNGRALTGMTEAGP